MKRWKTSVRITGRTATMRPKSEECVRLKSAIASGMVLALQVDPARM